MAAASLSALFFDRCAGASSDGIECQFTSTDAFYYQLLASINKRERPLANLRGGNVASAELRTPALNDFCVGTSDSFV